MNKQTKMILGLAVVAGAGYLLYKSKKDKDAAATSPKNFANFVKSDKVTIVAKCNGDYGKDEEGRYICCRAGYRSAQTDGKACGSVGQVSDGGFSGIE
jgi:hypothetical protein